MSETDHIGTLIYVKPTDVSCPKGSFKEELLQYTTSNTRWCHGIRCDETCFAPSPEEVLGEVSAHY